MTRVGVAVSTCNRRPVFRRSISYWRKHLPADAVLIVVDDCSTTPVAPMRGVEIITHDFNRGVAMTKNRCIAELMKAGCEHLFLSDDDCHPVTDDWWRPYVESPEQHLSWQWETRHPWTKTFEDDQHFAIGFPRGVMLYATDAVINKVGGMDPAYGLHGGEHVHWQQRIHSAGFGEMPFMDVNGSGGLWWSYDKDHGGTVGSTIPLRDRRALVTANGLLWPKSLDQKFPYIEGADEQDYHLGPQLSTTNDDAVIDHVLLMKPHGVGLDFNVGSSHHLRRIAAVMPVVGFDSFEYHDPIRLYNAKLEIGRLEDTVPAFELPDRVGLVRIAGGYQDTAVVLENIEKALRPGTYIVFDEWHGSADSEFRSEKAWREFADRTRIGWTVIGHGPNQWAIRII